MKIINRKNHDCHETMDLKAKLSALNQIYSIYDDFIGGQEIACQKKCSVCCTAHVTVTTLEGYQIFESIPADKNRSMQTRLQEQRSETRFRPKSTTNAIADLAAAGQPLPEEDEIQAEQICPLLNDDLCAIYPVRPFACRCLVSRQICLKEEYADVDELVLSANTLFLQAIEHIDADGFSGNLMDVLRCLFSQEARDQYRQGRLEPDPEWGLVQNRPMSVLMIPPEYREAIMPIWQTIQQIQTR